MTNAFDWRYTSFGRVRKVPPFEASFWRGSWNEPEPRAPRFATTPAVIEQLIAWDAERLPLADQARRLGISTAVLSIRRRQLMRRGLIQPWQNGKGRAWSATDIDLLINLVETGHGYDAIARRLKRTRVAVVLKCRRIGIRVTTTPATLAARDVAQLLGIGCAKTIVQWIGHGWLKARNAGGKGSKALWRIQWDDLIAFLECSDHWMAWWPERMTNDGLREWARELRAGGPHWLTPGQVAERFGVCRAVPETWLKKGLLPAVRYGNWWFRESDLVGFVVPIDRPRNTELHPGSIPYRLLRLLTDTPQTALDLSIDLRESLRSTQQALLDLLKRGQARRIGTIKYATWVATAWEGME